MRHSTHRFITAATSLSLAAGAAAQPQIRLKYASFDPLVSLPAIPESLLASPTNSLFLVQFTQIPTEPMRDQLRAIGASIERFLTDHTHLIRLDPADARKAAALPFVRWVGPYHPAYRLSDEARAHILLSPAQSAARFSIQPMHPAQQADIADLIRARGGIVERALHNESRLEATLTPDQLLAVAQRDDVNFIDAAGPFGHDMDLARQIGGAHPFLSGLGISGQGVRGEVLDTGINFNHVAVQNPPPLPHGTVGTSPTGTSTYGIVFANWPAMPLLTGMLSDREQGIIGSFVSPISLLQRAQELTDPSGPYRGVFLTSSIGSAHVSNYTTISASVDDVLFQTDLIMTQSCGNTGINLLRPEAWAKNIVAVGGLLHHNTLTRADDQAAGSHGPASDGRIKPDLIHFYDNVDTIEGSSNTGTTALGGTSGSTPITAGYFGLIFQMWHQGAFRGFGGGPSVFADRPHASTARALAINTAYRYDWLSAGPNATLTRANQGWGMIDAGALYNLRNNTFIVNESKVLAQGEEALYSVTVAPGTPQFAATMVYNDPPGNPAAAQSRVNDLSLVVVAPDGTTYLGNSGLTAGNASAPGGQADTVDTVENVFIPDPAPGLWSVRILATEVVQDAHTEDPQINADFGLVVTGITTFCYANCDLSTAPPILNINDFTCFIGGFAAGVSSANCDLSTIPPVLNVSDFTCFLNAFAAGCP